MTHIDEETLALLAIGEVGPSGAQAAPSTACPTCRDELDDLRRVVSVARRAEGVALERPAPAVWDRIATDLGFDTVGTPRPARTAADAAAPAAASAPGVPAQPTPRRTPTSHRADVAASAAAPSRS